MNEDTKQAGLEAQEPVAWQVRHTRIDNGYVSPWMGWEGEDRSETVGRWRCEYRPLYAAPQPSVAGEPLKLMRRAVELGEQIYQRAHDGDGPMDKWWHATTIELHRIHLQLRATPASEPARDEELAAKAAKYDALNTPEIADFLVAVEREALHQRDRWGSEHDAGKTDADWFWLIGYLAGKAINKPEKLLHHVITTAAACLNWHAARLGTHTAMRPGIADPERKGEGGS